MFHFANTSIIFTVQRLERLISEIRSNLTTVTLTRQGTQSELTDLIRARTELECTVADLQLAVERAGGRRGELEAELENVQTQITREEAELANLLPEWEAHRAQEIEERRRTEEAQARLDALYAKQGRLNRFRTRADRDQYLRSEIASVEAYRASQANALEGLRNELSNSRTRLQEVKNRMDGVQERGEDGRQRARELGKEIAALKDQHAELAERRKELWREDAKLSTVRDHAAEELKTAERNLASMMDKVCLFTF